MYSKLIIIGNLGKNGELRYTPDGKAVLNFSLAESRKVKDEFKTLWYNVTVFGKQAELNAERAKSGAKYLVEGRLMADWDTGNPKTFQRKDGTWGASFEVTAENVRFLSGKDEQPANDEVPF